MAVTQIRGSSQIKDSSVTATQVDSTVIVAAGTNPFTGDQSFGGFKATNVATPSASTDAANKSYVDSVVNGLDWHPSVRVASTANVDISTDLENGDTLDGTTLATGDRVLLKDQSTGSQNGIYVVPASGAASRATDADASAEVTGGLTVFVNEGTANANTQWTLTTNDPITLGTTALVFAQVGGTTSYSGDETSIHLTGTTFSTIFGSTAGTVCEGNDSRLSDARTPVGTALASGKIWIGISNAAAEKGYIVRETPSGTINGSNADFVLANTPVSGTEQVFKNGILMDAGSGNDYTIAAATITFETGQIPVSGDKIRVTYIG